jgi:hypothetical protein
MATLRVVKSYLQAGEEKNPAISINGHRLPAPLVPENYESRKLMKLYFDRDDVLAATEAALLDGDLTPVWKMRMVATAWKEQIPGSLPNDDVRLSRMICGGKDDIWLSMKGVLLLDWIVCANGRLYNDAVAQAIALSVKQYRQREEAGAKGRAAKAAKKAAAEAEKAKSLESNNSFSAENSDASSDAVTSCHVTSRHVMPAKLSNSRQEQDWGTDDLGEF